MVNVDTVYQKVLALANKEQRGYITPQEFNLLADKAQMEIFESYFHDNKTAYHKTKNQSGYSDEIDMISEKLQFFRVEDQGTTFTVDEGTQSINIGNLIPIIYRLDTMSMQQNGGPVVEMVELGRKEVIYTENNPLTMATMTRPVYVREGSNSIRIYPTLTDQVSIIIYYFYHFCSRFSR